MCERHTQLLTDGSKEGKEEGGSEEGRKEGRKKEGGREEGADEQTRLKAASQEESWLSARLQPIAELRAHCCI